MQARGTVSFYLTRHGYLMFGFALCTCIWNKKKRSYLTFENRKQEKKKQNIKFHYILKICQPDISIRRCELHYHRRWDFYRAVNSPSHREPKFRVETKPYLASTDLSPHPPPPTSTPTLPQPPHSPHTPSSPRSLNLPSHLSPPLLLTVISVLWLLQYNCRVDEWELCVCLCVRVFVRVWVFKLLLVGRVHCVSLARVVWLVMSWWIA